jgi:hypothetical protein
MTRKQRPPPEHVETCLFDLDDCLYRNPEFPRDMAINIQGDNPSLRLALHPSSFCAPQPKDAAGGLLAGWRT